MLCAFGCVLAMSLLVKYSSKPKIVGEERTRESEFDGLYLSVELESPASAIAEESIAFFLNGREVRGDTLGWEYIRKRRTMVLIGQTERRGTNMVRLENKSERQIDCVVTVFSGQEIETQPCSVAPADSALIFPLR